MGSEQSLKIEKNIPITLPRARANGYASLVREMVVGDSLLCQTMKEITSVRAAIYRTGYKAVVRKQADETWRVWKIKKDIKN